jgi:SAM-dependent methyltransferase
MTMSIAPVHADNAAQADYWNRTAGQRWTDRQEEQDLVLRPVSDRLVAAAAAKPGERVIDVGCGCGDTTIDFAARVSPGGEVLGLDISGPMLKRARERARPDLPARFELADATVYDFASGWADLVVSRFGVMFFADPPLSFANLRRGLKPRARLVFACWREAKQNPWMMIPLREAKKHAPPLPETNPDDPGPFAFADDQRVRRILSAAGFADAAVTPQDLELDISIGRGLDAAVAGAMGIGPTSRILDGQPEAVRAAAAADIRKALAERAKGDSVPLGAAIWIVTAVNPAGEFIGRLGPQKRPHGEIRLVPAIGVFRADRAGPPRPASRLHAVRAGCVTKMAGAGGDIVAAA